MRKFSINTMGFKGEDGEVKKIHGSEVKMVGGKFESVEGTEFEWDADYVFLAMGFVHPVQEGMLAELKEQGLEFDACNNVKASFGVEKGSFATSVPGVYACGDVRRGQSLIVWAISEGRKCADEIHRVFKAAEKAAKAGK